LVKFLIDEQLLGIDRYLEGHVKFIRVGDDEERLPLGSSDPKVAQFAKDNDLIIVTNDGKLIKQCNLLEIEFIALDLVVDLARKVLKYED
jgi:predicted nuclease of predicted toxin-antitoxin system